MILSDGRGRAADINEVPSHEEANKVGIRTYLVGIAAEGTARVTH